MRSRVVWLMAAVLAVGSCGGPAQDKDAGLQGADGGQELTALAETRIPRPVDAGPDLPADFPDLPPKDLGGELEEVTPDTVADANEDSMPPLQDSTAADSGGLDVQAGEGAADLGGEELEFADVLADSPGTDLPFEVQPDVAPDVAPEAQEEAAVVLSAAVVQKALFDDYLQISCITVDGFGEQIDDPGAYELSVSAVDLVEDEFGFSFPTAGNYVATCTDSESGLDASAEFVVSHEAVGPAVSSLSAAMAAQSTLIASAIEAAADDNDALLAETVAELQQVALDTAAMVPETAVPPPGGWPSDGAVAAAFDPEPDDDAYESLVALAAVEAAALAAALEELSATPSAALAQDVFGHVEELELLSGQMEQLARGAIGLHGSMADWDNVLAGLLAAQETYAVVVADMFTNPDNYGQPGCPDCFTLPGLITTMAVGAILSYVPSYQKMLKHAAKAAASMAVMLAIADAIDKSFPPGPDAPTIEYLMPGYGNAIPDGSTLSFFGGGYDYYPGNNAVIFIGPQIGDAVAGAVYIAINAIGAVKGLKEWSNPWELANAMKKAFNGLKETIKQLGGNMPSLITKGVVVIPVSSVQDFLVDKDYWQQIVNLGAPLPEVNDDWLPKVGIIIPISFSRGMGETFEIVILP